MADTEEKQKIRNGKACYGIKVQLFLVVFLSIGICLLVAWTVNTFFLSRVYLKNRTKIVNEYSSWETELKDKEHALDLREQELNDRETTLKETYGEGN